jgi:uncharacterized delta-60 repeat protein
MLAMGKRLAVLGLFYFVIFWSVSAYAQETAALTIRSRYGTPDPAVGTWTYDIGAEITAGVETPVYGPSGIRCDCAGWRARGSPETLPPEGTASAVTFIITMNTTITWLWEPQYYFTAIANPPEGGYVTPPSGWYEAKSHLQVQAHPNPGWKFSYWTGALRGTANPQWLCLRGPRTVTANFALIPVADFVATPTGGNPPLTVQFTDASTGNVTSWAWDFDNNGTVDSTEQNPSYTYNNPGGYVVKLTVTGPEGSDEEVKLNYIIVGPWAKSYGRANLPAFASSIQQTIDAYIVAGTTYSLDAPGRDFWVLKLKVDGAVSWQKTYSGGYAYSVQQTSDSGYVVAGLGFGSDWWVVKLNGEGGVSWQNRYGGDSWDLAHSIRQTTDGGYIVAGATQSFGAGYYDIWVLKLNSDGTVDWQKRYGGSDWDGAYSVQQTIDHGYVVAGYTRSFGAANDDFWVLKLNPDGTVSWQKRYGGTGDDSASSIQQTSDGGYIVAGETRSFDAGGEDFWVLKLNSDGAVAWQKRYGGTGDDYASSIQQTSDGGYIVAGSYSAGWGCGDFWILKLNSDGTVSWQKRYGGAYGDYARSIQQTSDGGYIVAGSLSGNFWVLKLASDGTISFNPASGAYVVDTDAVPVDTNCSVADTTATVVDTSATITDATATVTDTDAIIEQQAP